MAEPMSTPRITAQYLDSYVGRNVMLVGKVLQLRGDSAVLDADGNVTAILNRDVHLTNGNAAQIIGKVNPDLSIKVLSSRDLGPDTSNSPPPSSRRHTITSLSSSSTTDRPSGCDARKGGTTGSPSPRHTLSICSPAGSDDNRGKRHFPAGAITNNPRSASRPSKPHPLPACRIHRRTLLSRAILASKDHISPRTAKQVIRAAPLALSNPIPLDRRVLLGNSPYPCAPATRSPTTPRKPRTGSGTRVREEMAAITSKDQDHGGQRYKSRVLSTIRNCWAPPWTASDVWPWAQWVCEQMRLRGGGSAVVSGAISLRGPRTRATFATRQEDRSISASFCRFMGIDDSLMEKLCKPSF
ncbi:Putative replication factor A protein [Colletotrichum destructivum]|uniref:Replication factor A protein n=1 Tax=Colletotrichum destructivum TaxID=34406 RepID=A0AAX4ITX5_9PEZI|nr:Putative replication factor A protein [Colletotrichum destructivum]